MFVKNIHIYFFNIYIFKYFKTLCPNLNCWILGVPAYFSDLLFRQFELFRKLIWVLKRSWSWSWTRPRPRSYPQDQDQDFGCQDQDQDQDFGCQDQDQDFFKTNSSALETKTLTRGHLSVLSNSSIHEQ